MDETTQKPEVPQPKVKKHTELIVAIVILIVILLAVFAIEQGAKSSTSTSAMGSNSSAVSDATYKDGTYSATGSYHSPAGLEQINVTLTLQNNIVTAASATSGAQDAMSTRYQGMFIGGFQAQVVGKNINSLHLTEVSGSSLTPKGFADAVSQIETQAHV